MDMNKITFDKFVNIVLLVVILFLALCSRPTVTVNEGISEEEHLYKLQIFQLENKVNDYEHKFNILENAYKKDSINLSVADSSELNNFFSTYLNR